MKTNRHIPGCNKNAFESMHVIIRFMVVLLLLTVTQIASAAVSCSINVTGPVFGVYNPLTPTPTVTTSIITATCTLTGNTSTTVNLTSSYSTGSSGTYAARTMKSGSNSLNYNLYFDAAFTQIRGDGTGGSQTGGGTLTLTPSLRTDTTPISTIYGRIPAGQDVAPGNYSDTITVTITY